MNKDFRFKVISEGQKNGVSSTCRKYEISRTLYYRWLKRYKSKGINGLKDVEKEFTPANKTDSKTEQALLSLIEKYPSYGPRALKYLFDEQGYNISESAVYNIMKRNKLNKKEYRLDFANRQTPKEDKTLMPLDSLQSGECWVFWITDYGYYENIGNIYEYTLYDIKSKIAGTRLYNEISFHNFESLLTEVAMPIAKSLNMKISFLYFLEDNLLVEKLKRTFKSKLDKLILNNGFAFEYHLLDKTYGDINQINLSRNKYTENCLSFLLTLVNKDLNFTSLKNEFQNYVKDYNLHYKFKINGKTYTPVDYHNKLTKTKLILPIWAYMDREY